MNIQIEDLSYHARRAMELCGCPIEDAQMVASILADDVFHSTLDWQTEEELRRGCFEAQQILEENRADYEAYFAAGRRHYAELVRAQSEAEEQEASEEVAPDYLPLSSLNDELVKDRAAVTQRELSVVEREAAVAQREIAVAQREAEATL